MALKVTYVYVGDRVDATVEVQLKRLDQDFNGIVTFDTISLDSLPAKDMKAASYPCYRIMKDDVDLDWIESYKLNTYVEISKCINNLISIHKVIRPLASAQEYRYLYNIGNKESIMEETTTPTGVKNYSIISYEHNVAGVTMYMSGAIAEDFKTYGYVKLYSDYTNGKKIYKLAINGLQSLIRYAAETESEKSKVSAITKFKIFTALTGTKKKVDDKDDEDDYNEYNKLHWNAAATGKDKDYWKTVPTASPKFSIKKVEELVEGDMVMDGTTVVEIHYFASREKELNAVWNL